MFHRGDCFDVFERNIFQHRQAGARSRLLAHLPAETKSRRPQDLLLLDEIEVSAAHLKHLL